MKIYQIDYSFSQFDLDVCIPILITFVFFTIYWFVANSEIIKGYFYSKDKHNKASLYHVFFTKTFGFFSMGIMPLLIIFFYSEVWWKAIINLLSFNKNLTFIGVSILVLSLIIIPLSYFSGKKTENQRNYPQVRSKSWTNKTLTIYLFGWSIYLFGYELLFRGVLLLPLYQILGFWPAVIVNISLYSSTHIPKGLTETLGAIPLGFVLCILTIISDSIWIAFIVHLIMAWTNSLSALKNNPDMKFVINQNK